MDGTIRRGERPGPRRSPAPAVHARVERAGAVARSRRAQVAETLTEEQSAGLSKRCLRRLGESGGSRAGPRGIR